MPIGLLILLIILQQALLLIVTNTLLYDMIYLTAIGLPPGGSSRVHIYTQTIHRTTQSTQTIHRTTQSTQTIHRTTQYMKQERG